MTRQRIPDWQLPVGVDQALWEYIHTPRLAQEEDSFFEGNPLIAYDTSALLSRFTKPGRLIDLGCGAGRHSIAFAELGFEVMSVDLSHSMLVRTGEKCPSLAAKFLARVKANLCQLDFLPNDSFVYAISMYSTLGMIQGRTKQERVLAHVYRILKPGGFMAIHVHNFWLNLADPQGQTWLCSQLLRALRKHGYVGVRRMNYRGIPNLKVQLFRWKTVKDMIVQAGFDITEVLSLNSISGGPLRFNLFAKNLRAGGWIIFARKSG